MAYELKFTAYDDADWAQAVEIIDANTNLGLEDAADALFEIEVTDCGSRLLGASTADDTVTRPDDQTIQWVFTKAQMSALEAGRTYRVGCRMTPEGGNSIVLFTGQLAFLDGGLSP